MSSGGFLQCYAARQYHHPPTHALRPHANSKIPWRKTRAKQAAAAINRTRGEAYGSSMKTASSHGVLMPGKGQEHLCTAGESMNFLSGGFFSTHPSIPELLEPVSL